MGLGRCPKRGEGGSPTFSLGTDAGRVSQKALCKDAYKWSNKVGMQGSIKTATQSRCTMQRHKWLSMHRCSDTND